MIGSKEALRIVLHGAETRRIEYKRSMPWAGNGRFKLIKSIAGMANAGGGYIVFGYDEDRQGDERFAGMEDTHLATWDITRAARDVNNYIQPDIDLEVLSPQSEDTKATFVVLCVPSHGAFPHICKRDAGDDRQPFLRSGALYLRNQNKEVAEISRLEDWRNLITRLTMSKRAEVQQIVVDALSSFGAKGLGSLVPSLDLDAETQTVEQRALGLRPENCTRLPLLVFAVIPAEGAVAQEVEQSKLSLKFACVDYSGWPFLFYLESGSCPPRFDEDSIWALDVEPTFERPAFDYWLFNYTRSLFYKVQITPESSVGLGSDLDAYTQAKLLAEALLSTGRLYQNLGFQVDAPISILLKYANLSESRITVMSRSQMPHPYAGSQVVLNTNASLNELLMRPWSLAGELVSEIGRRVGVDRALPLNIMEALARKHLSNGRLI
jgi:hypothetical protein